MRVFQQLAEIETKTARIEYSTSMPQFYFTRSSRISRLITFSGLIYIFSRFANGAYRSCGEPALQYSYILSWCSLSLLPSYRFAITRSQRDRQCQQYTYRRCICMGFYSRCDTRKKGIWTYIYNVLLADYVMRPDFTEKWTV